MNLIDNILNDKIADILYYCYKNDISFPRSCGTVSMIVSLILYTTKNIRDTYDIFYVRGHYKNNNNKEDCLCTEYIEISRIDSNKNFSCKDCTCDYITFHSWIELKNKYNGEEYIMDFTSIQFHEDISNIENILKNDKFSKEELFTYLNTYSVFIINNADLNFNCYIRDKQVLNAKEVFNISKKLYKNNRSTDLIDILLLMNIDKILFEQSDDI